MYATSTAASTTSASSSSTATGAPGKSSVSAGMPPAGSSKGASTVPPELLALAEQSVNDGHGWMFVLQADGKFRIIGTPPGQEGKAANPPFGKDDPKPALAQSWAYLADKIVKEHPQPAAAATAGTATATAAEGGAGAEEPGVMDTLLGGLAAVGSGVVGFVDGLVSGVTDGIGGLLELGWPSKPAPGAAPAAPTEGTAPTAGTAPTEGAAPAVGAAPAGTGAGTVAGAEPAKPAVGPVDPANHQSRSSFVGPQLKENGITTAILDTIWPYFNNGDIAVSGYLTDTELIWKVNFHWDEILWTCDKLGKEVSVEQKATLDGIASGLMAHAPDPGKGSYLPGPVGTPADTTSPDAFLARYEAVKSAKVTLKAVLDEAGIWAKHPITSEPGKSYQNACDFIQPPSNSKHGVGYAIDIDGDRARIIAAATPLGMTAVCKEAYTHVEFAGGAHPPGAAPAAAK